MNYARRIVCRLLIGIFCLELVVCSGCGNHDKKYKKEELETMEAEDLYKIFKENGLEVDNDLKEALTEKELADYIKKDFDLLIQGSTSRSDQGYAKLAKDVREIYEKIIDE